MMVEKARLVPTVAPALSKKIGVCMLNEDNYFIIIPARSGFISNCFRLMTLQYMLALFFAEKIKPGQNLILSLWIPEKLVDTILVIYRVF